MKSSSIMIRDRRPTDQQNYPMVRDVSSVDLSLARQYKLESAKIGDEVRIVTHQIIDPENGRLLSIGIRGKLKEVINTKPTWIPFGSYQPYSLYAVVVRDSNKLEFDHEYEDDELDSTRIRVRLHNIQKIS